MTGHTPVYNIPVPDNNTKAVNLGAELYAMGLGVESALQAASIPPTVNGDVRAVASAAARDAYYGTPTTEAQRLALQARGPLAIRTDLGVVQAYAATYNASTNPGGRSTPGWYIISGYQTVETPLTILSPWANFGSAVSAIWMFGRMAYAEISIANAATGSFGATESQFATLPIPGTQAPAADTRMVGVQQQQGLSATFATARVTSDGLMYWTPSSASSGSPSAQGFRFFATLTWRTKV